MKKFFLISWIFCIGIFPPPIYSSDIDRESELFLAEIFSDSLPFPEVLWIDREMKSCIENILGHKISYFRLKYWKLSKGSVWILSEKSKTKPLKLGIVIKNERVHHLKVLGSLEREGQAVKSTYFLNQFIGRKITRKKLLDLEIDSVSGATVSSNVIIRIVRVALYMNSHI